MAAALASAAVSGALGPSEPDGESPEEELEDDVFEALLFDPELEDDACDASHFDPEREEA